MKIFGGINKSLYKLIIETKGLHDIRNSSLRMYNFNIVNDYIKLQLLSTN